MVQYFPVVTGSLTVNGDISVSGNVVVTGSMSGTSSLAANSQLLSGTGSVGFTTTSSFTVASSSLSSRTTQIEAVYATTGSNSFRATQSITGSLTVTGQIIAQTINVQQVTSSIVYSSGSNVFGCDINSRQTFTGSFYQTGSVACFSNCLIVGGALSGTTATFSSNIIMNPNGPATLTIGASDSYGAVSSGAGGAVIYLNGATRGGSTAAASNAAVLATDGDYYISNGAVNSFKMIVNSSGNVGVGTISPATLLHLNSTTTQITLQNTGGGSNAERIGMFMTSDDTFKVISLNDNNTTRVDNILVANVLTGAVGIGTGNPINTTLYVNAAGISQAVSAVEIAITGSGAFQRGIRMLNSGLTSGESLLYMVGRNSAPKNTGQVYFYYAGDASNNNRLSLGLYAVDDVFNIFASSNISIGSTSDAGFKLYVNGTSGFENTVNMGNASISWGYENQGIKLSKAGVGPKIALYASSQYLFLGYAESNGWERVYAQATSGGVYLTNGATSWTGNSDERLKNIDSNIENAVDKLSTLRTVKYSWKSDKLDRKYIGLIAQDVQKVLPEIVEKDEKDKIGTLGVRYTEMIPVLVKAIQEQQCTINTLKTCIGIA